MSFASGFQLALQLQENQKKFEFDKAIDEAGKKVSERKAEEERAKKAQQDLINNATPAPSTSTQEAPGVYQQGDSLGLKGYQTGNKPVEATVPTAPAGYMTREANPSENDLSPGGLDYPSANPSTEQTLVGNYGTTAAFKGEKPTREDALRMQQDTTDQFQTGPFTGKNEQVANVADLAVNKPVDTTQEKPQPKPLDNLNEHVTAADMAKESYQYSMEVLRELEKSNNPRAAAAYKKQLADTELTLANAEHTKFTTASAVAKQVGNMADNALELIKQPGADVNKIYFDTMSRAKEELGFTGKIPFSLDPRENIKTLERFQKDSMTTIEKADLGIKNAVAQRDSVYKQATLQLNEAEYNLKALAENRAQQKENREERQAAINNLAEGIKLKQRVVDSLNSVQDKDLKKTYSDEINTAMVKLDSYSKTLGVKTTVNIFGPSTGAGATQNVMSNNTQPGATNVQPGTAANTQTQNNNLFSNDVAVAVGAKPISETAGGYSNTTPAAKTSVDITKQKAADELRLKELKANIEKSQKALNPGMETESDIERRRQNSIKAKQNREAVKEMFTGKKKRQALEESLLKDQKEFEALQSKLKTQ